MIIHLALRNIFRQRKRYALIAIAVAAGFALITIITGVAYGAMETVKNKAARYFAGHVSITGYVYGGRPFIEDPLAIIGALDTARLPIRTLASRTVYYRGDATIFFNGETIRQRKLVGIDFTAERTEFMDLTFFEGGAELMVGTTGKNGVLISTTAARLLRCRVGDDLTLSLTTDTGQYNTVTLIIRGIFKETSLFGYVAYMQQDSLNGLLQYRAGTATDIAVYVEDGVNLFRLTEKIRNILSEEFNVFPAFFSREERDEELTKNPAITMETLAVLSLDAQLAEIKQLLDALLAVTYFVLIIFIAIVMVGILNTFRVLVHERTQEIGCMRALGMQRLSIKFLFLIEAGVLAAVSSLAGLLLGVTSLWGLSYIDFTALPASGMFLDNGRLHYFMAGTIVSINAALMILCALIAVWSPASKAGNIRPAEAIRSAA